jgi:hypothetical protein
VEVHCRLFPASDDLYSQRLFEPRALTTALVPSRFRDKEVFRFSHEYQLLYMCTSWMRDLTLSGVHPTLLWSLVDLVHLLHHRSKPIDWGYLTALLGDDMTAAHVGVALDYATRRGLGAPPPAFIAAVQAHQALVGAIQRKLVHGMLDHYLLGARDWRLPFPLPVPGRYNAARQLRKRPHRGAPR